MPGPHVEHLDRSQGLLGASAFDDHQKPASTSRQRTQAAAPAQTIAPQRYLAALLTRQKKPPQLPARPASRPLFSSHSEHRERGPARSASATTRCKPQPTAQNMSTFFRKTLTPRECLERYVPGYGRSPAVLALDDLRAWNALPPDVRAKAAAQFINERIEQTSD